VNLGCEALVGVMAIAKDGNTSFKEDGNAWHFMRRPTSIAFGDNGNLATCGEARTDNYDDETIDYSGPVLWSSDPAIFGARPAADQNGTHIDMLHETPYCMGIAFERDNAYWAFNGRDGSLDHCDFKQPHEVGGDDHSDGEVKRYLAGELLRVPDVPSHLAVDAPSGRLYAVDSGHGRVLALDTASGTHDGDIEALDPIAVHWNMTGAAFTEFVPPGTLQVPSGLALTSDRVWVTDNADGQLYAFDRSGTLKRKIDTGLGANTLAGVTLDTQGAIYVSDLTSGRAYAVTVP
jgi:outer membrane protein assembly factor BamB